MTFSFKLSKRLALTFVALGGLVWGCTEVPSGTTSRPIAIEPPAAVGDTLFADGFESGTLAWDDNFGPQAKSIVAGAARTGTRGLRVTFTPTTNGGVLSKFVVRGDRVYVRAAVRFPASWTGATGLLTLRAAPASNPWAGFGTAGLCPSGSTWATTGVTTTTPNLDVRFNSSYVGMPIISAGSCQANAGLSGTSIATYAAPLSVSKGTWHLVEIEAQLNTVGAADGWQRVWLDGALTGQWVGLTLRTSTALQWNAVSLEMPAAGVTQTQTLDLDDILVLRQRPGEAVATVQVSPATATLNAGQTVGLTATLRDAAGVVLTGRTVAWSSSNPSVATVNGSGTVTGTSAGSATISASSEGRTGSAAVTVAAPAPAGQVLLSEGFDDAQFGARGWYDFGTPAIATADKRSGAGSLQLRWAAGATNPPLGVMRRLFTATDRLYVSYWVKYSTDYVGSGKGYGPHEFGVLSNQDQDWDGLTFNYLNTYIEQNYQNGGVPRLAIQDSRMIDAGRIGANLTGVTELRSVAGCNGNTDGTGVTSCYQASPTQWYNAKVWDAPAVAFRPTAGTDYKGSWNRVEVELRLNSVVNGVGRSDGIVRYWLNGNLKLERTNVLFRTGANPNLKFRQFLITPYIGDGSPVTQTMWIDDLILATTRDGTTLPPLPPPPPAAVATVTVAPATATVAVGAATQLTAVTRDAAGATLTGRVITWTTSASGVATVVNGLVTGRAAGQATITAASEGRAGSATVTVPAPAPAPVDTVPPPPPPSGARWPNEPAGSRVAWEWNFDLSNIPSQVYYTSGIGGSGRAVPDVPGPVSPPTTGRIAFNPGLTAGTGPVTLAAGPVGGTSLRTWYHGFWFKVSPNYQNEMSFPGLKIWDMLTASPNGSLILQLYGRTTDLKMLLSYRWTQSTDTYGTITLARDRWHQIEYLVTDVGGGNARYDVFVNGVRDISVTRPKAQHADFVYGWIMGGGPGTISQTSYIYHDHVRVSVTP